MPVPGRGANPLAVTRSDTRPIHVVTAGAPSKKAASEGQARQSASEKDPPVSPGFTLRRPTPPSDIAALREAPADGRALRRLCRGAPPTCGADADGNTRPQYASGSQAQAGALSGRHAPSGSDPSGQRRGRRCASAGRRGGKWPKDRPDRRSDARSRSDRQALTQPTRPKAIGYAIERSAQHRVCTILVVEHDSR